MTDPPSHDQAARAFGAADPTRDIRLPPLADRPPSAMPQEWASMQPTPSPATCHLRGRERDGPLAGPAAPSVGRTPRRPRRWPWVALTLLPVLVIAGAGIALLVLLRAG